MRVALVMGGGDAPGLNAVLRAFVKRAVGQLGWDVLGVEHSFQGLFPERFAVRPLTPLSCQGLLGRGGTILGTTNRGDPFAFPMPDGSTQDRGGELADAVRRLRLDGLVVVGGDGTQRMAHRLMTGHGVPVIGVPKTIDNDLGATDLTFGFRTAVDVATEALDRLHTTAASHDRVMFLEVMGRDAGHIALESGIAGGADVILLPELPYSPERVASKIHKRRALGRTFSIVVVAEGAVPRALAEGSLRERRARIDAGGGAAAIAREVLSPLVQAEMRFVVLGHLQRGGSPSPFDRILATRFGVGAVDLAAAGRWGELVCLRQGRIEGVPLGDAVQGPRLVDPSGELVATARAVGIELGA
ncbi:MAG: ATP-dependent 6-phosphofructokinase [Alphaproteobacteria bacterium]|nr:ATP-dependent 6-phosphofructokinase [Alphaproteobacteria bacterium]